MKGNSSPTKGKGKGTVHLRITCPFCGQLGKLPLKAAGRKIRCTACWARLRVPGEAASGGQPVPGIMASDSMAGGTPYTFA